MLWWMTPVMYNINVCSNSVSPDVTVEAASFSA